MSIEFDKTLNSVKEGVTEVAETAHEKTNEFHENYVSKVLPDCGKYGEAAKFAAEMIPGVAEYNALKDGDWVAFAIAAGIDVAAVAAGAFTAGAGYAAVKAGTTAAKAGAKAGAKVVTKAATKEVVEASVKKAVKEVTEAGTETVVKAVAETGTKKVVKESAEAGTEKVAKEGVESTVENSTKVIETVTEGGSYRDVKKLCDGTTHEVHHMPAKGASFLNELDGPAIKMEKLDHMKTASWGPSAEARQYREMQRELIENGKFREAVQLDIDDITSKFGHKYDEAIEQMLKYADKLELEGAIK